MSQFEISMDELAEIVRKTPKGLSRTELAARAKIGKEEKEHLERNIDTLLEQGRLYERRGRLHHSSELGVIPAKIVKVSSTYGFAKKLEEEQEMFIPGRSLMGALPGDYVWIRPQQSRGELPEGEVMAIITKADFQFTGVFSNTAEGMMVLPDNVFKFPVRVMYGKDLGAKEGEKVLAKVVRRGDRHMEHRVEILHRFGDSQLAKNCCAAVLAANGIQLTFSDEVQEQARALESAGIHPKEIEKRLDLRDEPIFTIDGADTKDIDDAISLKKTETGWELGVHIADVSHYVTPGTPLDKCAFERGTSVYYADSVIPMLPRELSNGICSLNPQEDRLAFSALMELDGKGDLKHYRFAKTVIRSRLKGVYKEVNRILDGSADAEILEKYAGLIDTLREMDKLADIRMEAHHSRGGLELESTEAKFLLDEDGKVLEILPRTRGKSECMIEEFMLLANEAAASFAQKEKLPFVYRVHDKPSPEKLETLSQVLEALGIETNGLLPVPDPKALSRILTSVQGKEIELVVNNSLLRSMAKAKYSSEHGGHYGLVLENYAHFTSPIRRYPDLSIHRIMSAKLSGVPMERIYKLYGTFAKESADHSTEMELKAMAAERECEDCYKAEYLASRLGEQFDGVISGVAAYGFYVELPNTAEGLVPIEGLPKGYYSYDGLMQLTDSLSGKRYRIGDTVRIVVAGVDVSTGMVDFGLVDANGNPVPMQERGSVRITTASREEPRGEKKPQKNKSYRKSTRGSDKKDEPFYKKIKSKGSGKKNTGKKNTGKKKSGKKGRSGGYHQ